MKATFMLRVHKQIKPVATTITTSSLITRTYCPLCCGCIILQATIQQNNKT